MLCLSEQDRSFFDYMSCPTTSHSLCSAMQGHLLRQVGGTVPVDRSGSEVLQEGAG